MEAVADAEAEAVGEATYRMAEVQGAHAGPEGELQVVPPLYYIKRYFWANVDRGV